MDLKIGKASDELNLKVKKLTNKFNSLIDLQMIIEDTEKINNNERLEIEKTEGTIKKVLQEFRTEKKKS